jgi:alkylation response protein AidB-like acyl-CoA dehydrogenase
VSPRKSQFRIYYTLYVDATFTDEQQMLESAANALGDHFGPGSVADLATADPARVWRELTELGMTGLSLPVEAGGSSASAVEVAIVAEALGRHLVPAPYLGPVMAMELLAIARAHSEIAEVLSGGRPVTLGLDGTLADLGTSGNIVGWDAQLSSDAVGILRTDKHYRPITISLDDATMADSDLTRRLAHPRSNDPSPSQVGEPIDGDALLRWQAFALTVVCADMVGVMRGALEMAVDYVKDRVQFGRPIGSFQAVQHLCADQAVVVEAARAATYYSAWGVDGLSAGQALAAARTAKAYVSRSARQVTECVLQLHGGMGQTWESLAHVYLRRAMLDRHTLGDETVHIQRLGA